MPAVDTSLPQERSYSFFEPLVKSWLERIAQAKKAKQPFVDVAKQCEAFFSGSTGFMWKSTFKSKYLGDNINSPKFQVTISKAFELVAIFGPALFWRYPLRRVNAHERVPIPPQVLGFDDPQMAQEFEQFIGQQTQSEKLRTDTRNKLMQAYLNYSQREQPNGLAMHAELSITDALVKGRGLLWLEKYRPPGGSFDLTGLFHDSVDNFGVDPDCTDPTLTEAAWIYREHADYYWVVEDRFGLDRGTLANKGNYESGNSQGSRRTDLDRTKRRNGQTNDIIVWYEIWSKCGPGTRIDQKGEKIAAMNRGLVDALEETVGDYAYLCVTEATDYPLNAPSRFVALAEDDDVKQMFAWPIPTYLDNRWPVAVLDFYRNPGSAWPIPPMAPGLGELIALNILVSAFLENAYENRKQIIAYLGSAVKEIEAALKSQDNPAFVEINENAHKSITDVIMYLNRPEMNKDPITAIDYISMQFDKRTGLSEILYAMNTGGVQSRSAYDVKVKEQQAGVRPEKMSRDVAVWLTQGAELEKFLATWVVKGQSLVPLLGSLGAQVWTDLIENEDPEVMLREMRCMVEASDIRRPNRERDASNLQAMAQSFLAILEKYSEATGDTKQINAFMRSFGESIEQEVDEWQLGDWRPNPPPEVVQAQQEQMELEKQKLATEVQVKQMDIQLKTMDMEMKQVDAQQKAQAGEMDAQSKMGDVLFGRQKAQQDLDASQEDHILQMHQKNSQSIQNLIAKRREHEMALAAKGQENELKLQQMKEQGKVKAQQMAANGKAAAKSK